MTTPPVAPVEKKFIASLETFIRRWAYSDYDFGKLSVGDPNLMRSLRANPPRALSMRMAAQIASFMEGGAEKHSPEAVARAKAMGDGRKRRSKKRKSVAA